MVVKPRSDITFLSPVGQPVIAEPGRIVLPDMEDWQEVPAKTARIRIGSPEAPWPPEMAEKIEQWRNGGRVDLAEGGQIRLGVSAGLIASMPPKGKMAPIFVQFDATHPTRPLELTPPAGILGTRNVFQFALRELGEEIIITEPCQDEPTEVWHWTFKHRRLCAGWVRSYAKAHNMTLTNNTIEAQPANDFPGLITLVIGRRLFRVWIAFESDTGSLEVIFPLTASIPPGVILQDGEILPNGKYRGSRVIPLLLTDKARVISRAFLSIK